MREDKVVYDDEILVEETEFPPGLMADGWQQKVARSFAAPGEGLLKIPVATLSFASDVA
jgi:hypothetical protein